MPKSRKTTGRNPVRLARKIGRKLPKAAKARQPAAKAAAARTSKERSPATSARPSKKGAILALLQRPKGAAISDFIEATGWQVHSVRAALTGLRKEGMELLRDKDLAGVTHYRLAAQA